MGQLGPIRGGASLPFLLEEKKGERGAMGHEAHVWLANSPPFVGFSPTWEREGNWHTPSYYKRGGGVHLFTHNFRIINSS